MIGVPRRIPALMIAGLLLARGGQAGQTPAGVPPSIDPSELPLPAAFAGPPPPTAPQTIARDAAGQVTIRAVRLAEPLRLDGRLDEPIYAAWAPASDFIQNEPQAGAPSTEKTDVWVSFDNRNVYVSIRASESQPDRQIAREMRRDNQGIFQGDVVAFMFDTFYDRRNSVLFNVNPLGGVMDGQVTNERQNNGDWNPIWDVKVGRFEGGWTVEAAIPFKSLRYRPGRSQVWGFNVRRNNTWKNEVSYLVRTPAGQGTRAIFLASLAATLVGVEAPPPSRNLEIKPYAISDLTTDRAAVPRVANDIDGDVGVDVKYGLTQGLTADFTYNTDFAQVEADEQQINLTRFSLFFPEKREFFLENQGVFGFGGVGGIGAAAAAGDEPVLFYSRRIGLSQGGQVPIQGGGRVTGRLGRFSIGALDIRTDDDERTRARETNFAVLRVKRDVLRRSSLGVIVTHRSIAQSGIGSNTAYGVDGTFAFFDNLAINTYWARTDTDTLRGEDVSYRGQLDYNGDRYGVQLERLVVGDDFNPEVGFVRRDNQRQSFGLFRFSPRPQSMRSVRKLSWTGSAAYIEDGRGRLETRDLKGEFAIEYQNSDRFSVEYLDAYEFLPAPFRIATGITLPVGGYDSENVRVAYNFGRQRNVSGNVAVERGTFYSGHKTTLSVTQGRMNVSPQVSLEPIYSANWVTLAEGAFTTHLPGSRVTYTMTPRMFASVLLQYNSSNDAVTANARLRWEYRPGSELFVVLNEQRDTLSHGFPALTNRALVVKVTRLFRF